MTTERWVPTCCNACGGQTGILVKVIDGKAIALKPNGENPIGVANIYNDFCKLKVKGGRICPKGAGSLYQLYDPDRIRKPLKRVGHRGQNQWQEISWEEAIEFAAEKLQTLAEENGPHSLAWFSEDHSFTHIQQDFCNAYGTPNYMNHANLCDVARKAGFKLTVGDERPIPDIANSKFILIFGWNPLAAVKWMYLPGAFKRALDQGAKLVVVDPVYSETAQQAHEWLSIVPGTDGALALALGHVIVRDNLYDHEFVKEWTVGFAEYRSMVKDKTPQWAEGITGIKAQVIEGLARELATTKPAVIDTWCGVSHYSNGTEATRAVAALSGLLGQFDKPGTLMLADRKGNKHRDKLPNWPNIEAERVDGRGTKYPLAHKSGVYIEAREAMLTREPYPIKGGVFVFQNFVMSLPNIEKSLEALGKLDFIMVMDPYLSETALMADLVLPGTHFMERYDLNSNWVTFPSLSLRQPVVEPLVGMAEYDFIIALARKMGFEGFSMSYEEYLDDELGRGIGLSLEELKALPGAVWIGGETRYQKYQEEGFKTPSGKFELASSKMTKLGYSEAPDYYPTKAQVTEQFPFWLINWKVLAHTHSRTQNNPYLMKMVGDNPLWIHPQPALDLGLQEGEEVYVCSAFGEARAKVKITDKINPRAVGMIHGFGHWGFGEIARGKGIPVNLFYQGEAENLSGQAVIKEGVVGIKKITRT